MARHDNARAGEAVMMGLSMGLTLGGPQRAAVEIAAPSGFGFVSTIPFQIFRQPNGAITTNYAPTSRIITPVTNTYYVSWSGSNANAGTEALPLLTLAEAFTRANTSGAAATIYLVAAADMSNAQAVIGTVPTATVPINLIGIPLSGVRPSIGRTGATGGSWVANPGGTAPNVWRATHNSFAGWGFDREVLTARGHPRPFDILASTAAVNGQVGSMYQSVNTANDFRRLNDGTGSLATIAAIRRSSKDTSTTGTINFGTQPFYMANIVMLGNWGQQIWSAPTSDATQRTIHNCVFGVSFQDDCVSLDGRGLIVVSDTVFYAAGDSDGANYHSSTVGTGETIEINVVSYANGVAGAASTDISANGSTIHDGRKIIRINCVASDNGNRNFHDVGIGTRTWMLGCHAANPTSAVADDFGKGNFAFSRDDSATDTVVAWLDSCTTGGGGAYDLWSGGASQVYTRNMDMSAWRVRGTGTVSSY